MKKCCGPGSTPVYPNISPGPRPKAAPKETTWSRRPTHDQGNLKPLLHACVSFHAAAALLYSPIERGMEA